MNADFITKALLSNASITKSHNHRGRRSFTKLLKRGKTSSIVTKYR